MLSESPWMPSFLGGGGGLEFSNFCKNPKCPHFTDWEKPFLGSHLDIWHSTIHFSTWQKVYNILRSRCLKSYITTIFSDGVVPHWLAWRAAVSLCLWDSSFAVVSPYLSATCGELGPDSLWITKTWGCSIIAGNGIYAVSPPSLWILNPGIQSTGILSVVGLICWCEYLGILLGTE